VFPKEWADTHHNLGAAYKDRIKGEHSLNLEQAIACYEAALQVRTKEVSPQSWAETHNNLGIAYSHRICGERTQNLEKAIAVLQAALQIRTCSCLPISGLTPKSIWALPTSREFMANERKTWSRRSPTTKLHCKS
jgi:hypothetical protein